MAQLVEHHLAKVGVAGSNPVVRSRTPRAPLREPFFVRDKEEAGAAVRGFPWRYEREPGRGLALYLVEGLERCRRMCVSGPRALAADGKASGSVDRSHDGAGSSPSASSTTRPTRSGPGAPRARALAGRRRARRRSCPPRHHPGRPPRLFRRQREMPVAASKTARACAKTFSRAQPRPPRILREESFQEGSEEAWPRSRRDGRRRPRTACVAISVCPAG